MVVDDNPSDCVSAPIEACEILQDRRVHGDQHPVTVAAVSDTPDNVGIGSTFGPEVGDRLNLHPSIFERKDEATAGELLVKDEGGHGVTPASPYRALAHSIQRRDSSISPSSIP